jgi:hypothetical protein
MRRLLLVSGNLGLRMAVSGDYEIAEERPRAGWRLRAESLGGVEAVLLDLRSREVTSRVMAEAVALGYAGAFLIFSVAGEDWSEISETGTGPVRVLELPVSGSVLSQALADLFPEGKSSRFGHRGPEVRLAAPPAQDPPPMPAEPAAAGAQPRTTKAAAPAASRREPRGNVVSPPPLPPIPGQPRVGTDDLVRRLRDALPSLEGLAAVADELVEKVVASTTSEAGAVLVPDGSYWRLVAGSGIRHVEWRLAVGSDSWLVEEVIDQRHGLIVEDTDIARQRLAGVPLASWENLMAGPVLGTAAIVLLARHEPPYGDEDIRTLTADGGAFRERLLDAIALRELARSLQPFADAELQ